MVDVRVRNLDDKVATEWRERARRHGRSLEAELRALLTEEAWRPRQELTARLREFHGRVLATHGQLPDMAELIRADRDERG